MSRGLGTVGVEGGGIFSVKLLTNRFVARFLQLLVAMTPRNTALQLWKAVIILFILLPSYSNHDRRLTRTPTEPLSGQEGTVYYAGSCDGEVATLPIEQSCLYYSLYFKVRLFDTVGFSDDAAFFGELLD